MLPLLLTTGSHLLKGVSKDLFLPNLRSYRYQVYCSLKHELLVRNACITKYDRRLEKNKPTAI